MRLSRQLVTLALGVIGAGYMTACAPQPYTPYTPYTSSYTPSTYSPPTLPDKVPTTKISVESDSFKKYTEYNSEAAAYGPLENRQVWVLVGRKHKDQKSRTYFVQWGNLYNSSEWKFFSRAATDKAETLEMKEVSRKVDSCSGRSRGCSYDETYNIYFTEAQMRAGAKNGLTFKVFAKNGEDPIVTIPAAIVKALLDKMAA